MRNLTFVISALCLSRKKETWIFTLKNIQVRSLIEQERGTPGAKAKGPGAN